MKKYFKFATAVVALLMVTAIVVTFEACRKTGETVEPTIVQNSRNPIAIYDHNTGAMTYSFDLEKLNHEFNKKVSRTSQDRYIIESIEILDEAPTDAGTNPEIKIVVIDTEEETSTTTWFMDTFAVKNVDNSNTIYFIDSEVESGTYQFATANDDGTFNVYSVVNGTIRSVSNELPCYTWRPKWTISCTAVNCTHCDKIKIGPHNWSCTENCPSGGTCTRGPSWFLNFLIGLVSILL